MVLHNRRYIYNMSYRRYVHFHKWIKGQLFRTHSSIFATSTSSRFPDQQIVGQAELHAFAQWTVTVAHERKSRALRSIVDNTLWCHGMRWRCCCRSNKAAASRQRNRGKRTARSPRMTTPQTPPTMWFKDIAIQSQICHDFMFLSIAWSKRLHIFIDDWARSGGLTGVENHRLSFTPSYHL